MTSRWYVPGLAVLLSTSATSSFAQTAPAQSVDAPAGADEEEPTAVAGDIIVTAQRRKQSLQDVPIAVSAISGDALTAAFVNNVSDLATVSPSVTFGQTTDQFNSAVRIRGIGTQVFSTAIEPSVSFVVDGVVLARQAQALTDLIDIERVEVLRGPQSTLFGKNASAGVINVITRAPSDKPEFDGYGSIEEDGTYNLRASASGPLGQGLGVRVTGYYADVRGNIRNIATGRDLNGSKSYGGRAKLRFEPTGSLSLTLIGDYRKSNADCCQFQIREAANPNFARVIVPVVPSRTNRQVNVNASVYTNSEDWGVSLTGELDLGGATLTSITAYRDFSNNRNADIDSTPLAGPLPGITLVDVNGGPIKFDTFTQELRLNGRAFGALDYIAGLYYYDFSLSNDFTRVASACLAAGANGTCASSVNLPLSFFTTLTEKNASGFVDGTLAIGGGLEVFGGARLAYNKQQVAYVRTETTVRGPNTNNLGPLHDTNDNWALMGRAGLRYSFSRDLSLYGSYARGFKSGAYDLTTGLTAAQFATQPIDPERSNAFEIGFRSQFLDRRLTFNATAFSTTYSNFQAQAFDPVLATNRLISAGKVRTRGLEFELTARPSDDLTFNAGVAYTDATITSFPNGPCYASTPLPALCRLIGTARVQDLKGADVPNSPDWKFQVSARYDIRTNGPIDFFVAPSFNAQSDAQFSLNQNPRTIQDGYVVTNLNVGIQDRDHRFILTAYVRNLFDVRYAGFILETPAGDTLGVSHLIPREAERLIGASLRISL